MFKVGIVGPEESKWPEGKETEVKAVAELILKGGMWRCLNNHQFHWFPTQNLKIVEPKKLPEKRSFGQLFPSSLSIPPFPHCRICSSDVKAVRTAEVTFVSGGCPVSKCDNCGKRSFSAVSDPLVGYVTCEFCGQKKKRRAGGADIWSEEVADKLGLQKEVHYPQVNNWPSMWKCRECGLEHTSSNYIFSHQTRLHGIEEAPIELKGFKARNIDLAEAVNVCYCLVPDISTAFCSHHQVYGHPTNGGCWTLITAENAGKEVHLIAI
jgi:hypothetical protein